MSSGYYPHRYRTQETGNMTLFLVSAGFFVGFFAFTALGQEIAKETARYARAAIPPAERWPRFRGERRPPRRVVPARREAEEFRESEIYTEGLGSLVEAFRTQCLGFTEDIQRNWVGFWESDKEAMKTILGNCLKDAAYGAKAKIPRRFEDVGYKADLNLANLGESTVSLITYGYPRQGRELKMTTEQLGKWMANPLGKPDYEVVR